MILLSLVQGIDLVTDTEKLQSHFLEILNGFTLSLILSVSPSSGQPSQRSSSTESGVSKPMYLPSSQYIQ